MLFEQAVARFFAYILIGLAYLVSEGNAITVGLAIITAMLVISPLAGSPLNPVLAAGDCFQGKRAVSDFATELILALVAMYMATYIFDCWKRCHQMA